jgi:hypothetical protein
MNFNVFFFFFFQIGFLFFCSMFCFQLLFIYLAYGPAACLLIFTSPRRTQRLLFFTLSLAFSISAGHAFFTATSVTQFQSDWFSAVFGIYENTPTYLAMISAGTSTTIGFILIQCLQNVLCGHIVVWSDWDDHEDCWEIVDMDIPILSDNNNNHHHRNGGGDDDDEDDSSLYRRHPERKPLDVQHSITITTTTIHTIAHPPANPAHTTTTTTTETVPIVNNEITNNDTTTVSTPLVSNSL